VAVKRVGSTACARLLEAGELDLGVVRGVAPPPGFSGEHLCDDRLWLATPLRHRLLKERPLQLASIAREPLVLYGETSQTRARVLDELGPLGAQVRVEVDGKASALEYVARGLGVSFLSLLPAHHVQRAGVGLRDVTALFRRSSFWVLRSRQCPPVTERVARLMRKSL
jgi:DNA-binding transcriptional LysR family regulator